MIVGMSPNGGNRFNVTTTGHRRRAVRVAEAYTAYPCRRQRSTCADRNQPRFLLGDRAEDVDRQSAGRGIVDGHELHAAIEQGGHEGYASSQTIKPGDE